MASFERDLSAASFKISLVSYGLAWKDFSCLLFSNCFGVGCEVSFAMNNFRISTHLLFPDIFH